MTVFNLSWAYGTSGTCIQQQLQCCCIIVLLNDYKRFLYQCHVF